MNSGRRADRLRQNPAAARSYDLQVPSGSRRTGCVCPDGELGSHVKGRPGFRGRPFLSHAWLSCAGTGELAPEIEFSNLITIRGA
jgi:hypothetical protein